MKAIYVFCIACFIICSIDSRSISNDGIHSIESDVLRENSSDLSASSDLLAMNFPKELRRTKRQVFNVKNCASGYCRKNLGAIVICVHCSRCPKGRC